MNHNSNNQRYCTCGLCVRIGLVGWFVTLCLLVLLLSGGGQ